MIPASLYTASPDRSRHAWIGSHPQLTWDLGGLEEGGVWEYLDDTATFVIPLHGGEEK